MCPAPRGIHPCRSDACARELRGVATAKLNHKGPKSIQLFSASSLPHVGTIGVLESKSGLICGCFACSRRPHSRGALGNNYGSSFCQEMFSVSGATDLGLARSVLPPSSMATITRKIPSFILPSPRFSIGCSIGGTNLLFSQNGGTDLAEPRSVAPRSQVVITFEN
jgi:hypothetical protein